MKVFAKTFAKTKILVENGAGSENAVKNRIPIGKRSFEVEGMQWTIGSGLILKNK
jgi:hypothetical protein